jgi:hypothetical protein
MLHGLLLALSALFAPFEERCLRCFDQSSVPCPMLLVAVLHSSLVPYLLVDASHHTAASSPVI